MAAPPALSGLAATLGGLTPWRGLAASPGASRLDGYLLGVTGRPKAIGGAFLPLGLAARPPRGVIARPEGLCLLPLGVAILPLGLATRAPIGLTARAPAGVIARPDGLSRLPRLHHDGFLWRGGRGNCGDPPICGKRLADICL